MKHTTLLVVGIGIAAAGCGASSPGEPDAGPDAALPTLAQLVEDYEQEVITRDDFRAAIADLDDGGPSELVDDIRATTLLEARPEPYRIDADLAVAAGAILVIEEGAEIIIGADVSLTVSGRLYAIGAADATIAIRAEDGLHFGSVELASGPNQLVAIEVDGGTDAVLVSHPFDTHTLIEDARFDRWTRHAILLSASSGLVVRGSRFGLETAEVDLKGEIIGSVDAGDIVIVDSHFGPRRAYKDVIDLQRCVAGYWPLIARNRFEGGEDDAIDLDYGCSAFVIGNHIRNFRPLDLSVMNAGVNGGGITGAGGSQPFIANNVIDGCFHGIGFKDGATPIIVNNTIINSNIGVTFYQSLDGEASPAAIMINNVLWNNADWLDGEAQDVVLNGKWWPPYNQVDDVQATLDARSNITATQASPLPGAGNTTDDPLLELVEGVPIPSAGSPALNSGLELIELTGVPMDRVLEALAIDHLGQPRTVDGATFPDIDRGAVERQAP